MRFHDFLILDSESRKFVKSWIYNSNNYRFCWMSYFLLGGLFVRSLTDRFRLFIMQPNGRFIELFLMDIIILNFINDELKSSDKKLPSQDSSIKKTIEKLIQSFENHWSVNWYCKKELFSNKVFTFWHKDNKHKKIQCPILATVGTLMCRITVESK